MIRTFKALSALLCYPSAELKEATGEIGDTLRQEEILSQGAIKAIQPLLNDLATMDIYDLQERYVLLFDRSRTLSLNLFEHVHGEGRERGPAMVDLLETYRDGGYDLASTELPDHLPIILEFLSTCSQEYAKEILIDAGHIIAALAERLQRRDSVYAAVLASLVEFAGVSKSTDMVQELLSVTDDDPEDLKALDDIWEEAEITFGPDPSAGCPVSSDMMAKMDPTPQFTQPGPRVAAAPK